MYKIEYTYKTGNSFEIRTEIGVLEFNWHEIEVAKECLRRIGEHYEWYRSINDNWRDGVEKPKWHNVKVQKMLSESDYINLPMDNGEEVQFWPPWIGYFESLISARIAMGGEDMEVYF